ncbi:PaaI family thioesterase [Pelagibacteraceae bacterium]|nr:PaaI family thioesterase [Pelagibacteraceae bacterium]|tara:strand:- start:434 stop:823 length:390 start_codon:yes stop_codon:yes gene_type:complete
MVKKIMDETNTGFMSHNGGLNLKKLNENNFEFLVKVKEIHLNTGKIAHGGFLSTIADTGMGTAAHMLTENKRCVTISLEVKFISAALLNQSLKGEIKIQKKTKSLIFITCEISNSEGIVVTSSGVWKIL